MPVPPVSTFLAAVALAKAARRIAVAVMMLIAAGASAQPASASAGQESGQLRRDLAVATKGREGGPKPAPTVRAHRVDQPIRIDGKLDEAIYGRTPAITDFV